MYEHNTLDTVFYYADIQTFCFLHKEGVLLGMGNPLLDISATVKPELLTKHNLKSNDAILTEEENIFNDLTGGYKVVLGMRLAKLFRFPGVGVLIFFLST